MPKGNQHSAKQIRQAKAKWEDRKSKLKAMAPLSAVGGAIGVGKGFSEETIRSGMERVVGKKRGKAKKFTRPKITKAKARAFMKSKIPWATARGITGAGSTMLIGIFMADALSKMNKKSKGKQACQLM